MCKGCTNYGEHLRKADALLGDIAPLLKAAAKRGKNGDAFALLEKHADAIEQAAMAVAGHYGRRKRTPEASNANEQTMFEKDAA